MQVPKTTQQETSRGLPKYKFHKTKSAQTKKTEVLKGEQETRQKKEFKFNITNHIQKHQGLEVSHTPNTAKEKINKEQRTLKKWRKIKKIRN